MLIEPSVSSFALIETAISKARSSFGVYDMEIVNRLFGSSPDCLRLPHRAYALLTGEFRRQAHEHGLYFDDYEEENRKGKVEWNPDAAITESRFVHFSDHPMAKPWVAEKGRNGLFGGEPECFWDDGIHTEKNAPLDCRARYIWMDLLDNFKKRRKVRLLFCH